MKNKSRQAVNTKTRVVAVGLDKRGTVVGISMNFPAPDKFYRRTHAECILIDRYGKVLDTILIARFGRAGKQLPIDPCPMCKAYAASKGIKIVKLPINI